MLGGSSWPSEPLTRFIGRESERRGLTQLLHVSRLVSLVGIGGVGKTRLAIHLRHEVAASYADGVTFVDLAPLVEPNQVKEAVAAALGAGGGSMTAEMALVSALHGRKLLLMLDNAEHLRGPVGLLLELILARCPGVSVLVTSRESLGLPGEVVFRLAPLALPPESETLTAAEALGYDAVRLFADRARALHPDFGVHDANAVHVAAICRRLDGIALAIEMAVPRLEVLTTRQLAERLHDRFGAVAKARRDVLPRQRTLRAMFDWSWELLPDAERRLLQLLALSVAGTTLGPLEALSAADGSMGAALDADVLDHLTALAQKSLVMVVTPGPGRDDEPRYRLLETTRQYALEQLAPGAHEGLCRLHAGQVAMRFERADAEWPVRHSADWLREYGPDADNLRAAMQWAFSRAAESALAMRLAAASFSLWWELPGLPLRERRHWYGLAMARVGPETPAGVQARLWLGQSWTDTIDGDVENYPAAARAVALFRDAGDPVGVGIGLWRAASTVIAHEHDPSAARLLDEALRVMEGRAATKWQALCHVRLADLLQLEGALGPALAGYDTALAMMRATGHSYGLMVCGGNRSYLLFEMGREDEAAASLRALHGALPAGLRHPLVSLLATVLAASGRDAEAWAVVLESLTGTVSIGLTATLARSMEALALLVANGGDGLAAARLLGFVLRIHAPERRRLGPRRVVYERLQERLGTLLSPAARAEAEAVGRGWSEAEAAAAALALCVEGGGPR